MKRANIGCGLAVTPGWANLDNSPSVRLAGHPWLARGLARIGLLNAEQLGFALEARALGVRWADSVRRIPAADSSMDAIYSCHMAEHLDRAAMRNFLLETKRVLAPGGVLRLALPDLALQVEHYRASGDADAFIEGTLLVHPPLRTFAQKLRFLVTGNRYHQWLYDGASLSRLLLDVGFEAPQVLAPGETTIADPGALDLHERADESLYVEARAPQR